MENRFNLVDDPWIPIADNGLCSLRQLFENKTYRSLGGTPVEKIALTKFLLAIAQAAVTPKDNIEWKNLGIEDFIKTCLSYLENWRHVFYLYGKNPFLQMPVGKAEIKPFGAVMTYVATGNTTSLTQYNAEKKLSDSQKALLLLTQMSMALGGKKTDNKVVLSSNYSGKTKSNGKPTTGKPGPGVGHMGMLHSFALGGTLHETLWFNLMSEQDLNEITLFSNGLGQAPWENMPKDEDCDVAKALKNSLMGRLIPLSRFCLITNNGLHLTEGIQHLNYKEGLFDPSVTVITSGKEPKVIWADPERRPWRRLNSLLGFISHRNGDGDCFQLKYSLTKAVSMKKEIGIWSGGLQISSNAGEQFVSGNNDVIESTLLLPVNTLGESWFENYTQQLSALDDLSKRLYGCVNKYFKQLSKDGKEQANTATHAFWQLCEQQAQRLLYDCEDAQSMQKLKKTYTGYILHSFDLACPSHTARQLDAWAKSRPNLSDYLKKEAL